jgi:hypothetical protein
MRSKSRSKRRRAARVALASIGAEALLMRLRGYPIGGNIAVRCRQGHLFSTIWIPGASVKSLRLGWWRLQWCPVGRHWSVVTPLKIAQLTEGDRREATAHRDIRLP